MNHHPRQVLLSVGLTLALLVAMRFISVSQPNVEAAQRYHAAVRETARELPRQIGSWRGVDAEVPTAAVALLKPNVMVSRTYRNAETGRVLSLVLVHCEDARDMEGHYPPNCYTGNGWMEDRRTPFTLPADGGELEGQVYHFVRDRNHWADELTVMNVIMLPNGEFGHGMREVRRLAGTYADRFFGAGQLQLVFGEGWTPEQRRETAELFFAELQPLISAILGEGTRPAGDEPQE